MTLLHPALAGAFLLATSPIPAQQAGLQVHLDRDAGRPLAAPASLVVAEAPGGRGVAEALAALLRSEACDAFEVPLRALAPRASAADRALAEKLAFPSTGGWALLDRQGTVRVRRERVPDADTFVQDLLRAGFRDRARDLHAYLKENPDSVDAREEILILLRQRAERAAMRLMGVEVPSRRERLKAEGMAALQAGLPRPKVDLSSAKSLGPTADLRAWGAFAEELDAAFRSGRWRELDGVWLQEARSLDAASPTLRLVYQRWQPAVESALRETPGSSAYWDLLLWMGAARGSVRFQPLVASLQPEPLTPAGAWPPVQALRAMLDTAKSPEDWSTLRELYRARWENGMSPLHDPDPAAGAPRGVTRGPQAAFLRGDWEAVLAPLLECSLRSGDTFRAESILLQALEASRWEELPGRAAGLARRCGQEALAARWGGLRVPGTLR